MIAIVMVNWNRPSDTLQAYASLKRSAFTEWVLIIVDNASSDGSFETISRAVGDDAIVIQSGENLGFAGGCNVGIRKAFDLQADYIYLLNNDATVLASTLPELLKAAKRGRDRLVLGSVVRYADSKSYQFFGARRDSKVGLPVWFTPQDAELLKQDVIETDFVLGAALFASRSVWNDIGLLDERYFLNFEETDWCRRAQKAELSCAMVPSSVIKHAVGATLGPIEGPLQAYFLTRNELLFVETHGNVLQRMRVAKRRLISIVRSIKRSGGLSLYNKAMIMGVVDYILRRFGNSPQIIREYSKRYSLENSPAAKL